jgi:hypothetical protein
MEILMGRKIQLRWFRRDSGGTLSDVYTTVLSPSNSPLIFHHNHPNNMWRNVQIILTVDNKDEFVAML